METETGCDHQADMGGSTYFRLCLIFAAVFSLKVQGLELNLNREVFIPGTNDACAQLICESKGNGDTIERATVSRVKAGRASTQLLTVSTGSPHGELVFANIRGSGILKKNRAQIRVVLLKMSDCLTNELFYCHVTYLNKSGQRETTFTMTGHSQHSEVPDKTLTPISGSDPERSSLFHLSELEYLAQKLARVEGNFASAGDRLEKKLEAQSEAMRQRVLAMETAFNTRVSKLEDRLSSRHAQSKTSQRNSDEDVGKALEDMERRMEQLRTRVDTVAANNTLYASHDVVHQVQECVRGMGDDVTKTYPRYAVLDDDVIQRQILCDTQTNGGGWIVVQRRTRGGTDFFRDWTSYRQGFGALTGDFWFGNEAIHKLTNSAAYELRVDIRFEGQELFAEYAHFRIESESDKYRLQLGSYTGSAGDAMVSSNNMAFSTFDADHDSNAANCAIIGHGAWWYKSCYNANLNGRWKTPEPEGSVWILAKGKKPVSFSEMKIRRVKAPHEY